MRVLAQESVHLSDILLSYFKTIHISIMIAYTEHKIQLSGTGNYRRLKKTELEVPRGENRQRLRSTLQRSPVGILILPIKSTLSETFTRPSQATLDPLAKF